MEERAKIEVVTNNIEKGLTISMLYKRFELAYKKEFYFECLWLLYSIIEYRTSRFLYYIGFTNKNRNRISGKKYKNDIKKILKMDEKSDKYGFNNLSGKLNNILKVIEWSTSNEECVSKYQKELKSVINKCINYNEIKEAVTYLQDDWRNKRNELMHSLCNKKISIVTDNLKPLVDEGFVAISIIDKATRKIKNNHVREKFYIQ